MPDQPTYAQFRERIVQALHREGCPLSPPLALAHPKIKTNFMMSLAVTLLPQDSMDGVRRGGNDYGVIQPCIRVHDKDQVWQDTDPWHLTFFEMAGAVVGGADSRERALKVLFAILTEPLGLRIEDLRFTAYAGRVLPDMTTDSQTVDLLRLAGVADQQIRFSGESVFGTRGGEQVAGPSLEVAWAMPDGTEREVATAVFLDFAVGPAGRIHALATPVAEVGVGLERAFCAATRQKDFAHAEPLKSLMDALALQDERAALLVADRMRAVVHAIGCGVVPRGHGRGYELRKLIREALGAAGTDSPVEKLRLAALRVVAQYTADYPSLDANRVKDVIEAESQHDEKRQRD
jgi:alanyl-tRNA synthetase